MRAIVLSGGGAKGAYQVGAFKALKKLHVKFDIITGTSIGALNGMFFAQKEYKKCYNLWKNIEFNQLFDDFNSENKLNIYKSYLTQTLNGGIKIDKMERLLDECYNAKKLYRCKYGVVAYNLTNKKPVLATTLNTEPDKLKEYIMASATCYPVFEPKKINGQEYIDGGYYDNTPINLAIDLGADEIIVIDLEAIGLRKKTKNKNVNIISISPNNKIVSFLMFEKTESERMICYGYNDTMKKFNKLEGNKYTFKKGALYHNYKKYKDEFVNNINKFVQKPTSLMKDIIKNNKANIIVSTVLEEALTIFEIDDTNIYNGTSANKSLIRQLNLVESKAILTSEISNVQDLKDILNKKLQIKNIYEKLKSGETLNTTILEKEILIAIYLYTIYGR